MTSDPSRAGQQWCTWDDFIKFGKEYKARPASAFVDSAASIFSTAVYQGKEAYNNADGEPDVENSDGVQNAWSYATEAAQAGITAGLSQFSDPWNKAFSSGTFAAIACPTWMMGYIQGQAGPAGSGKWAVAPVLPGGATNWGGSWLGVPTAAKNQAAAIALVSGCRPRLSRSRCGRHKHQGGHFPSNQQAAEDPRVKGATERLLQQRAGGADLRQDRRRHGDPADRPVRHADPERDDDPADECRDEGHIA